MFNGKTKELSLKDKMMLLDKLHNNLGRDEYQITINDAKKEFLFNLGLPVNLVGRCFDILNKQQEAAKAMEPQEKAQRINDYNNKRNELLSRCFNRIDKLSIDEMKRVSQKERLYFYKIKYYGIYENDDVIKDYVIINLNSKQELEYEWEPADYLIPEIIEQRKLSKENYKKATSVEVNF